MMGHLYERIRDPEGILSTFPAIANTLFGVAAGEWIRTLRADSARLLRRLVAAGLACFVAGELWSLIFPINKKLWTSSYVAPHRRPRHAGPRRLLLADGRKKLRGRWTIVPLVFGTNCIFAYAFSEFVATASVAFKFRYGGKLINSEDAAPILHLRLHLAAAVLRARLRALLRRLLLVLHLAPLPPQNLPQNLAVLSRCFCLWCDCVAFAFRCHPERSEGPLCSSTLRFVGRSSHATTCLRIQRTCKAH